MPLIYSRIYNDNDTTYQINPTREDTPYYEASFMSTTIDKFINESLIECTLFFTDNTIIDSGSIYNFILLMVVDIKKNEVVISPIYEGKYPVEDVETVKRVVISTLFNLRTPRHFNIKVFDPIYINDAVNNVTNSSCRFRWSYLPPMLVSTSARFRTTVSTFWNGGVYFDINAHNFWYGDIKRNLEEYFSNVRDAAYLASQIFKIIRFINDNNAIQYKLGSLKKWNRVFDAFDKVKEETLSKDKSTKIMNMLRKFNTAYLKVRGGSSEQKKTAISTSISTKMKSNIQQYRLLDKFRVNFNRLPELLMILGEDDEAINNIASYILYNS